MRFVAGGGATDNFGMKGGEGVDAGRTDYRPGNGDDGAAISAYGEIVAIGGECLVLGDEGDFRGVEVGDICRACDFLPLECAAPKMLDSVGEVGMATGGKGLVLPTAFGEGLDGLADIGLAVWSGGLVDNAVRRVIICLHCW